MLLIRTNSLTVCNYIASTRKSQPLKIKKTGEEQLYIYSCSKVATVTAALQLYEQGKFLLSDPLYEYLPEFKKMYVKDGDRIKAAENPITIRDLFTMTAGLSYATNTPAFEKARK